MALRARLPLLLALGGALAAAGSVPADAGAHRGPVDAERRGRAPLASAAAVVSGRRWPGRVARITYFNATRLKWPVEQAVRAWNASGARLRFVPASRRRARLSIRSAGGAPSDQSVSGWATVGFVPPRAGGLYFDDRGRARRSRSANLMALSPLRRPGRPHYNMAGVAAHELGHVLGLGHEDRRCATMNSTLWASCAGVRACRLLERDDIRGAIRLYGGRARRVTPGFCPRPPSALVEVGDPREYAVTLQWRNPAGPFFSRSLVRRGTGSCPAAQRHRAVVLPAADAGPGAIATLRDTTLVSGSRPLAGRYCYVVWSESDGGPPSPPARIWVDFDPPRPAAPAELRAVPDAAGAIALSWTLAPHPELDAVVGVAARDRCPANPTEGADSFEAPPAGPATVAPGAPGRYCVAVWSRDRLGALAGPATTWVELRGRPPRPDFEVATDESSLDAYFLDRSEDPDWDDEIAARSWDFGDGEVLTGNDPSPVHTYGAPGSYTVRLTVTDSQGNTATASRVVTPGAGGGG